MATMTYGTEAKAREYVTRILAAAGQLPGAPVYLTVSPSLRLSGHWPEVAATVSGLLPGVQLRAWDDVAAEMSAETAVRLPVRLAAAHRAVIAVLPKGGADGQRAIGPVALAETRAFTEAGRPVLAFTGSRLVAWPDVRVRVLPGAQRVPGVIGHVDVPARPDAPLPTLAASLRVLGITGADALTRAAGVMAPGAPAAMFRAPAEAGQR